MDDALVGDKWFMIHRLLVIAGISRNKKFLWMKAALLAFRAMVSFFGPTLLYQAVTTRNSFSFSRTSIIFETVLWRRKFNLLWVLSLL